MGAEKASLYTKEADIIKNTETGRFKGTLLGYAI